MTFLSQLWMPIVLSAVLVFIASSLIHMVIKWHAADFHKLSNEDAVRAVVRAGNAAPGQYLVPYCSDMKDMGTPEFVKKFEEGPVAFLTLKPPGPPRMGGALGLWFLYSLAIAAIAGYVASVAMPHSASLGQVCRVVGGLSFVAYAGGSIQSGIWMGKPWPSVAKDVLDALIYAALTAAAFGWLWPR
jgi:hypothetical protein